MSDTNVKTSAAIMCAVAFVLFAGYASGADRTVGPGEHIDAKSFRCITTMTPVRHFYVDNLRGDLDATVAAANSPTAAMYPPGSAM